MKARGTASGPERTPRQQTQEEPGDQRHTAFSCLHTRFFLYTVNLTCWKKNDSKDNADPPVKEESRLHITAYNPVSVTVT